MVRTLFDELKDANDFNLAFSRLPPLRSTAPSNTSTAQFHDIQVSDSSTTSADHPRMSSGSASCLENAIISDGPIEVSTESTASPKNTSGVINAPLSSGYDSYSEMKTKYRWCMTKNSAKRRGQYKQYSSNQVKQLFCCYFILKMTVAEASSMNGINPSTGYKYIRKMKTPKFKKFWEESYNDLSYDEKCNILCQQLETLKITEKN